MADKIYKVFVSSTFEDLRDERAEVQKALLKLNCLPVGMELFPAADDETWEFIKSQISDSDYYVVLVAGRYGSLSIDGKSFTEREFDYAQELKIPTIGFVHRSIDSIARSKSELDPDRMKLLQAFVQKVGVRPIRHFGSPHELALEVTTSFVDLIARRPAVGFVRANAAVEFKKYSEILEANRELEQRISELSAKEPTIAPWFDKEIECKGNYTSQKDGDVIAEILLSWRKIYQIISFLVVERAEEEQIFRALAYEIVSRARPDLVGELKQHRCGLQQSFEVFFRVTFVARGIVDVVHEQRENYSQSGFRDATVWSLTNYGKTQLALMLK